MVTEGELKAIQHKIVADFNLPKELLSIRVTIGDDSRWKGLKKNYKALGIAIEGAAVVKDNVIYICPECKNIWRTLHHELLHFVGSCEAIERELDNIYGSEE